MALVFNFFFNLNRRGNDYVDGRDGNDTIKYNDSYWPIHAELNATKVYFLGTSEVDTVVNVEMLIGN